MNDRRILNDLVLDFEGDDRNLLPPSSSLPSQLLSAQRPLRDSFFALIVPPAHKNNFLSFEISAKKTTSYFAVQGDSVPELDGKEKKSTLYIITDIHRRLANRVDTARKRYLALSFTKPVSGCSPGASKCMMFTLHHTETRKKGVEGKVGEVNPPIEVYVVGPLDRDMKLRVVRNEGKGKEKEISKYGDGEDEENWPRIDEEFIDHARAAFSREFDGLQPMVPREYHNRPNKKDSGGVLADIRSDAGPSELGPCVGASGTGDAPRPAIKTECGNEFGPVTNTGQGIRSQVQVEMGESDGVFINATGSLSDQLLSSQGYVSQPLTGTRNRTSSYSDERTNSTGVATSYVQYQSRGPSSNLPETVPLCFSHLSTRNTISSYARPEHSMTTFSPLQPVIPPQDPRRLPAEVYAWGDGEGHDHPPQVGSHEPNWFVHPNFNAAAFGRDSNAPQGRIQYPQALGDTFQGGSQAQEKSRLYSKGLQICSRDHGFSQFDVQPFAHTAASPHLTSHSQTFTGPSTRTPSYPYVPSQSNGQMLPPTFTSLQTGLPLTQPRRYPKMRNAGRDPDKKRKAQNPYPNIQQREHTGWGSAVARKQARVDRLEERFLGASGTSQMSPSDQNVAGGSQLAWAGVGNVISSGSLPTTQPHTLNGVYNFAQESPFYWDRFRSFPPPHSHHAELAMPVVGNDTDCNHSFFPVSPNLVQQRGPTPSPADNGIVGHNNFGLYPHSQHLPKMSDIGFAHEYYPYGSSSD